MGAINVSLLAKMLGLVVVFNEFIPFSVVVNKLQLRKIYKGGGSKVHT